MVNSVVGSSMLLLEDCFFDAFVLGALLLFLDDFFACCQCCCLSIVVGCCWCFLNTVLVCGGWEADTKVVVERTSSRRFLERRNMILMTWVCVCVLFAAAISILWSYCVETQLHPSYHSSWFFWPCQVFCWLHGWFRSGLVLEYHFIDQFLTSSRDVSSWFVIKGLLYCTE